MRVQPAWPSFYRTLLAALALVVATSASSRAEDLRTLVSRVKAVRSEGAGNAAARDASRALAKLGPESLIELLSAIDDADPVAANWLRAAVDAIAERTLASGQSIPAAELEAFVLDLRHAGPVRRLAYEWLAKCDPTAPDRLIPTMRDDPSVELRRDAVAREIDAAQELLNNDDKPGALAAFQKAFSASRDHDQVQLIAKQLKSLGHDVNLTRHFGCVQRWHLIAPFDNTDKKGLDAVYAPEEEIDLDAELDGKLGPIHWQPYTTPETYGVVDLNKAIGKHMGVVAYALTTIESATEQPVSIRTGSGCAVKVWLNGKLILRSEEYHHGTSMDQYRASVTLKPGRNTILIKVCQNEQKEEWAQDWSFQLRVCDLTGGGIMDAAD